MTLFVTGATGYLGSVLVALLLRQGYAVRALARSPERAALLPKGAESVLGDVGDEDSLTRAMDGCEGVFHLAAMLGSSAEMTREVNAGGARRVLQAAVHAGVQKLVYTSSSAAIVDASGLVSERATGGTALTDAYSRSKAEAEGHLLAAVAGGLDACTVNVVNAYGPSPAGPLSYNSLLLAVIDGQIDALVDAQVGWILAEDVARGHLLAYERGQAGRRYVLCGAIATFPAVVNRAAEIWGSPHRVKTLPPGSSVAPDASFFATRSATYGALAPLRVDDAQARALGFQPRGLEQGLQLTVGWLRAERSAVSHQPEMVEDGLNAEC